MTDNKPFSVWFKQSNIFNNSIHNTHLDTYYSRSVLLNCICLLSFIFPIMYLHYKYKTKKNNEISCNIELTVCGINFIILIIIIIIYNN